MWSTARNCAGVAALVLGAVVPASATANPAVQGAVPAPLAGAWVKNMSLSAWHRHSVYDELAGRWSIVITRGGLTRILEPPAKPAGTPLTTMHVTGDSGSVVFGPTADGYCSTKASYTWHASGGGLLFRAVSDPCLERRILMTVGPWARA
jgi:hypothetical protein